jgi:hypothetical protein
MPEINSFVADVMTLLVYGYDELERIWNEAVVVFLGIFSDELRTSYETSADDDNSGSFHLLFFPRS